LDVSMVSGVFEELPLECDDGERDIYLQVWQEELEKLIADASEDIDECTGREELDQSVAQVLTSHVKAHFAALAAEAACTEEGADSQQETSKEATKKRKAFELDAAWIAVVKHFRLTKMRTRLENVSTKKQKTISNANESVNTASRGSHDAPVRNGTRQETEPDELQSGEKPCFRDWLDSSSLPCRDLDDAATSPCALAVLIPANLRNSLLVGGKSVHSSHKIYLIKSSGIYFCDVCGVYGSRKPQMLADTCSKRVRAKYKTFLNRMRRGLPPR